MEETQKGICLQIHIKDNHKIQVRILWLIFKGVSPRLLCRGDILAFV